MKEVDDFIKYYNGTIIGKYGEKFNVKKISNDNYSITQEYLFGNQSIKHFILDHKTINSLIEFYCERGYKEGLTFKNGRARGTRALNLGEKLHNCYKLYLSECNNKELREIAIETIKQILEDASELKLNIEEYIQFFINAGQIEECWIEIDDETSKYYLGYYEFIKQYLTSEQKFVLEQEYELPYRKRVKNKGGLNDDGLYYLSIWPTVSKLKIYLHYCSNEKNINKTRAYDVPYIKFMLDAEWIYLSISYTPEILNEVNIKYPEVVEEIKKYVIKNWDLLLDHWDGEISDEELYEILNKIKNKNRRDEPERKHYGHRFFH